MPEILLVADDLTGAIDASVAFAGGGGVRVARHVADVPRALADDPRVLAVSCASREVSVGEAEARLSTLAGMLDLRSVPLLVKKVDSRLKGHPGAETALLARLSGRDCVLAAPAIPAMGRIQRAGRLSGIGIDRAIDIAARFAPAPGLVVPDIADEADFDVAAAIGGGRRLWAGARGLTFALARHSRIAAPAPPVLPGPALFAIGSRDPITRAQLEALGAGGAIVPAPDGDVPAIGEGVRAIALTDGGRDRSAAEAGAAFAVGIVRALRAIRPATLLVSGGETADAVLGELGIGCLDVVAEIAPGLPVCTARTPWGTMHIATKSGGFGAPDLLVRIAGAVRDPATQRGAR